MKWLGDFSYVFELITIITGFFYFKKADAIHRKFLFFLCLGFVTDLISFYFYEKKNAEVLKHLFNFYSLLEALFFTWYITSVSRIRLLEKSGVYLIAGLFPFWVFTNYLIAGDSPTIDLIHGMFDLTAQLTIAALSTRVILKFVEEEERVFRLPDFWFTFGLFGYSFCTFILYVFKNSPVIKEIWYAHNLISVAVYLIFMAGFILIPGYHATLKGKIPD